MAKLANLYISEIAVLQKIFGNNSRVADMLNVNRSCVSRWHKGEIPDAANKVKITSLLLVMEMLQKRFNEEGANLWLQANNPRLEHRKPIDLIKTGNIINVLQAVEDMEIGTYH